MSADMHGDLGKMPVVLAEPVQYQLALGSERLALNPCLGQGIRLRHLGEIHCVACGRTTRKSFNQGHCYPCSQRLARCDICIVRPEKCHFDQGTCREPDWGEAHCMQPHVVYLANSSGVKVGITRQEQVPTRWIDQGAVQALPILRVASRYISGLVEVAMKAHVADKTDWRRMLKGGNPPVDLPARAGELLQRAEPELAAIRERFGADGVQVLHDAEAVDIHYPVLEYPDKIKALNLDKTPEVEGRLLGIKGQYLILDSGVLNIRKYGGYEVELSIDS